MSIINQKDSIGALPLGTELREIKNDPPPQQQIPPKSNRKSNYSIVREIAKRKYGRTAAPQVDS